MYKPKKKKQLANPKISQSESSNSGELSELEVVETEVEIHPIADEVSFSDKARQKLGAFIQQTAGGGEDLPAGDDKPKKKYYNSYARKREKEHQSELGNLITTILVIAVTAAPMREGLKPNDDEVGSISIRIASILWRHNLLTGKLSGDALDAIAILAVTASYWQRTKSEREQIRIERLVPADEYSHRTPGQAGKDYYNLEAAERPSPIDPYLDKLAAESEEV